MRNDWNQNEERYFGIGIFQPKTQENIGTLWRTAYIYGASFVFIIGRKYKPQASDVTKTWSRIPLFQYEDVDAFLASVPYSCKLVGIELAETSVPIHEYAHPARAVYVLGSETNGLPNKIIEKCHDLIQLPGTKSLNVAVAGSITVFDRINKLDYINAHTSFETKRTLRGKE